MEYHSLVSTTSGPCLVCNHDTRQVCPVCTRFICARHLQKHHAIHGPLLAALPFERHLEEHELSIVTGIVGASS